MDEEYRKSLCEVAEVLENSEENIQQKIPKKLKDFIYNNRISNYNPRIDFSKEDWEEDLSEDAKSIIALIYRDCLVSKEERKKLLKIEENELYEKYNPDNIFKNNNENNESEKANKEMNSTDSISLTSQEEQIWYKKIIKKILSFLKK